MKGLLVIISFLVLIACSRKQQEVKLFMVDIEDFYNNHEPENAIPDLKKKFENGLVEEFSANGSHFRFKKSISKNGFYDLEVNKEGKWVQNLCLQMPSNKVDRFFITQDIDLNNANDLTYSEHGNKVTYFFNNDSKQFDTIPLEFAEDNALLDSSKLIYGTNSKKDDWNIDIFSIANHNKKCLLKARMPLKNNTNNGGFEIVEAIIYKCPNNSQSDIIFIDRISIHKQFSNFSLRNFMKELAHSKRYIKN